MPNPTPILIPTFHFMSTHSRDEAVSTFDFLVHDDFWVQENTVEIENHEALVTDALQKVRADTGECRQGRLQALRGHTANAHNHVRQQAQLEIVTAYEDDSVQVGQASLGQVEKLLQVEHRQDAAAHIDDAQYERRRAGQRSQISQGMNFLNKQAFHGVALRGQAE